ncbi:MAG: hypothetical protein M3186_03765 [Actinomycetota bacterium]|nr:hypothetical protein [Actinomycetota bacterium]
MKLGVRIGSRRVARGAAAVDAYAFPLSVQQRLQLKHPDLRAEHIAVVEGGLRQWFRILTRRPSARLAMPSRLADDMWHEFLLHTHDYAAFCDMVCGRFLHHQPESAMSPDQAEANRSDRLLLTLLLARQDDNCALPLLFRADQEIGLTGGRRYVAGCGTRGECYDLMTPGLVCLRHLAGVERRVPVRGTEIPSAGGRVTGVPHYGGCGGGCAGAGCGGCGS